MTGTLPVRVLVVGAGAIGCFYASRLHRPDASPPILVSLVCRSNYAAIKAHGVRLRTHNFSDYTFRPEHTFPDIAIAGESGGGGGNWNYVVVTTKALPDVSGDGAATITSVVGSHTVIVLIQNGVGVEEPYRKRFPRNVILSAVTVVSAEQVEPGVIVQNRWTRVSVGPYTDGEGGGGAGQGDAQTREFVKLLAAGGIKDAEIYDEKGLQQVRWHKIAINASMNPSSVLSNGTGNARMSKDAELREHLLGCMHEVFHAASVVLGEPLPAHLATAEQILRSVERNTDGRPSMLLDWEKGARMELEVILGNPIRMAKARGVEMARLQTMYALLKMGQMRRDEEKAKLNTKAPL